MTVDGRGLLPESVVEELLRRWAEPHRHYHSTTHLIAGLEALASLGGKRLELMAFWFHDAVHSNTTPADEEASAALVGEMMGHELSTDALAEVQRLVLLTAGHRTNPDDSPGQRVCDADLSGLGADEVTYQRNVTGIRAELPHLTDAEWVQGRGAFVERFLRRDHLFATECGRRAWETPARRNLARELAELELLVR